MAQFASDAFTNAAGTQLPTHNAAWAAHPSYTTVAVISDANRVRNNTSAGTGALYYHSGAPATADYSVSEDLFFKEANGGNGIGGVTGRTDTAANTMYMARYAGLTSDAWQLYKFVAGTATLLGSSAEAITDETSHNIKLEMIGSAIKLYKDGGGVATVSVTDTDITAAGKSGLFTYNSAAANNTAGIHPDNFSADDVSSGITAALTGQSITVAQGSTVAAITAPLTGQSITVAQGTVTVDPGGVSAALTGQSASVALGNVSAAVTVGITGQSIPLSLGTIVPAFERAITGQGVTASLGNVVAAVAPAITGQLITVSTGTVSVGGDIVRELTGQSLTVAQGNLVAANEDATDAHDGWLQPVKRRKQSKSVRRELERLFKKAEVVVEKINDSKPAPKTIPKTAQQPGVVETGLPPIHELQMVLMHMQMIQDQMTEQQMQRMAGLQAQIQFMYNIRARAALLAA